MVLKGNQRENRERLFWGYFTTAASEKIPLKALTKGDGLSTALKAMEAASNSRPGADRGKDVLCVFSFVGLMFTREMQATLLEGTVVE